MVKNKIIFIVILIMLIIFLSISMYATKYIYNNKNNSSKKIHTNIKGKEDELYELPTYESVREMIYPVGSIYISVTDSTVAQVQARFGGTWEVFGSGKTLVGINSSETEFNTIEKTGGVKSVTLTANQSGIQAHNTTSSGAVTNGITGGSHSHQIGIRHSDGTATTGEVMDVGLTVNVSDGRLRANTVASTHTHNLPNHTHSISAANAKEAHTNLQPYITVYMYKRVN